MNNSGISFARIGFAVLCGLAPFTLHAQSLPLQGSASLLVATGLGVTSATELDGATICLESGSTTERLVADYFSANGMSYATVPFETAQDGAEFYAAFFCDVFAGEPAMAEQVRQYTQAPADHFVLPEIIGQSSAIQVAPTGGTPVRPVRPAPARAGSP